MTLSNEEKLKLMREYQRKIYRIEHDIPLDAPLWNRQPLELTYGDWTVIKDEGKNVLVRCKCGVEKRVKRYPLTKGKTFGCKKCHSGVQKGNGRVKEAVIAELEKGKRKQWSEVAKSLGVSKQRISSIVRQWIKENVENPFYWVDPKEINLDDFRPKTKENKNGRGRKNGTRGNERKTISTGKGSEHSGQDDRATGSHSGKGNRGAEA